MRRKNDTEALRRIVEALDHFESLPALLTGLRHEMCDRHRLVGDAIFVENIWCRSDDALHEPLEVLISMWPSSSQHVQSNHGVKTLLPPALTLVSHPDD